MNLVEMCIHIRSSVIPSVSALKLINASEIPYKTEPDITQQIGIHLTFFVESRTGTRTMRQIVNTSRPKIHFISRSLGSVFTYV